MTLHFLLAGMGSTSKQIYKKSFSYPLENRRADFLLPYRRALLRCRRDHAWGIYSRLAQARGELTQAFHAARDGVFDSRSPGCAPRVTPMTQTVPKRNDGCRIRQFNRVSWSAFPGCGLARFHF